MTQPNINQEYADALAASVSDPSPEKLAALLNVASLTAVGVAQASKDRQALTAAVSGPSDDAVQAKAEEVAALTETLDKARASVQRATTKVERAEADLTLALASQGQLMTAKRDADTAKKSPIIAALAAKLKG